MSEEREFTVKVKMKERRVPHLLAMLRYIEALGKKGSSRMVCFYADGDGDFRPEFRWDESLPSDAKPVKDVNGDRVYDAG